MAPIWLPPDKQWQEVQGGDGGRELPLGADASGFVLSSSSQTAPGPPGKTGRVCEVKGREAMVIIMSTLEPLHP